MHPQHPIPRPKVVTLSGGTGGFTVLRGLRDQLLDITAICTVFDSGGSTGVLRDQYGALPMGDERRCLLALIPEEDAGWRDLMMARYEANGSPLSNHSLGNLLLLSAEKQWGRLGGIARLGELLHIRGRVLPVSTDDAHLTAELSDGSILRTEAAIDTRDPLTDERGISRVWLEPSAHACRDAIQAIEEADVIVIGPGDLFTSAIPNLLPRGATEAINASTAQLVYIANIMTKGAETRGYCAADFVDQLCRHGIARAFDHVLINTTPIPDDLRALYWEEDRAEPVTFDAACRARLLVRARNIVEAPLLSGTGLRERLLRHSSKAIAKEIMTIAEHVLEPAMPVQAVA